MLKTIEIENYILIDKLSINICSGLNIITGETGAGKSILLGAVSLLLGGRGDSSLIKGDAKQMFIEAEFDVKNISKALKPIFENYDIDYSDDLTIRRIINRNGKSKSYVNEEPVTQSFLKEIGALLVDIHSQHQTFLISSRAFQTEIIDIVAGSNQLVEEYKKLYKQLKSTEKNIATLKEEYSKKVKEKDFLQYQYNELDAANLKSGEQEELETERELLSNASTIAENLHGVVTLLSDGEYNTVDMLQNSCHMLSKIERYIKLGEELSSRLSSALIEIKDISSEAEAIASDIEENPARLTHIEERLDLIYELQQKHHVKNMEELIGVKSGIEEQILSIDNSSYEIEVLEKEYQTIYDKAHEKAKSIRELRVSKKDYLSDLVCNNLCLLGMPNAKIDILVDECDTLNEYGTEIVDFLFSANGGKTERIDKIASGGEMSRLMLTLKSIVAKHKTLPTIIFDEIDTGVSGKVADSMGSIMEELSQNMQIINITHLPQVAAKGSHHLYVYKEHLADESVSNIVLLSDDERVEQIAIMLSGSEVTESARKQAILLLSKKF